MPEQDIYRTPLRGEVPSENMIRSVDRLLLPTLHLITTDAKLRIIEVLDATNGFLTASELVRATGTPTSSFFKFEQELKEARLVANLERGAYTITTAGHLHLNFLLGANSMTELRIEAILANLRDQGTNSRQLEQIKAILSQNPERTSE